MFVVYVVAHSVVDGRSPKQVIVIMEDSYMHLNVQALMEHFSASQEN